LLHGHGRRPEGRGLIGAGLTDPVGDAVRAQDAAGELMLWRRARVDWMVLPLVLVLALVIRYPAVRALTLGFYHYRLNEGDPVFNGATNFQLLAGDPVFWAAIKNTLVYTGVSVAVTCLVGLVLALLTERLAERLP